MKTPSIKGRPWLRKVLPLLLAMSLLAVLAQACGGSTSATNEPLPAIGSVARAVSLPTSSPEVGSPAPNFAVTINGQTTSLSDFKGKVVFINFWASWCPSCRKEMPDIEAAYQEFKNQDVVFIGIDIREAEKDVARFAAKGGYHWTMVIDRDGAVSDDYQVYSIPASFFIDKAGIVRATNIGPMTTQGIRNRLMTLLK